MPRLRFLVALGAALLLFLTACRPAPSDPADRALTVTARVISYASTGGVVRADSMEVVGVWPPVTPPTDGYGPVESIRFCALGGAGGPPESGAKCVTLLPTATTATVRLPFDLSGLAPGGSTAQWTIRGCVETVRRGVASAPVCREQTMTVTFPAPPPVAGLTITTTVRAFP